MRAVPDIKCLAANSDKPTVNDNPGIKAIILDSITMGILMLGSNNDISEANIDVVIAAIGSSISVTRRECSAQITKAKTTKPKTVDQKTSCQLVCINIANAPLDAPNAKKVNNGP